MNQAKVYVASGPDGFSLHPLNQRRGMINQLGRVVDDGQGAWFRTHTEAVQFAERWGLVVLPDPSSPWR